MVDMGDVYGAWYKTQDNLKNLDSLLGQIPGVGDESDEFSRVLRTFSERADDLLRSAFKKLAEERRLSEQAPAGVETRTLSA